MITPDRKFAVEKEHKPLPAQIEIAFKLDKEDLECHL